MSISPERPIFIVGSPRSGTTLLRDLLRSHPRLTFPGESQFMPRMYAGYGDPKNARQARALGARLLKLRWVRLWQLELTPPDFDDCRSYQQIISRLYESWAKKQNKARWGDKTPQYACSVALLAEVFPDAQFVHIYRDGRDVTLSWLRAHFGPQNTFSAAKSWQTHLTLARRDGRALEAGRYHELCYESLLSAPRETLLQLCEFLGEEWSENILQRDSVSETCMLREFVSVSKLGLRDTTIVAQNQAKWKTRMSSQHRQIFESVAGATLRDFGYETLESMPEITKIQRLLYESHHGVGFALMKLNQLATPHSLQTIFIMESAKLRSLFQRRAR